MKVLIPGISGAIARKVARRLVEQGHEVIGIDARPWPDAPASVDMHVVDIRKRAAEDVFRRRRPQAVIHMATVTSLSVETDERERINLGGTRAVFDYCRSWGVEHVLFVGRHTFYGAGPDAPLYHLEDEPPVSLQRFPELADLVAADLYAASVLWRMPELTTTILRLCYTLGPSGHGTLASFLKHRLVPMVLGYDPLFQYLHEDDAVEAIVLALGARKQGVYNVAGPGPLPLSVLAQKAGRRTVPLPASVLARISGHFGLPKLARGAIDHIKYPVVIDASAFREATGFEHRFDEIQTLEAFVDAFPASR